MTNTFYLVGHKNEETSNAIFTSLSDAQTYIETMNNHENPIMCSYFSEYPDWIIFEVKEGEQFEGDLNYISDEKNLYTQNK